MQEEFEDTKWVIAIENQRKTNEAAKKRDKGTNKDLQNTTQKAKDPPTPTKYVD
jgi:hypothetical protein